MHYKKTNGQWNINSKPQKNSSWSQKCDLSFNQIEKAQVWHLSLSIEHYCTSRRTCCQRGELESFLSKLLHINRMTITPCSSVLLHPLCERCPPLCGWSLPCLPVPHILIPLHSSSTRSGRWRWGGCLKETLVCFRKLPTVKGKHSSHLKGNKRLFILSRRWVTMAQEHGFELLRITCSNMELVVQFFL